MNTGIEVLWSETIGLCKKLNIIYNIITCNPETQATGESDMFFAPQTGSFRQFVSMKWFQKLINSFVYVIKQWCHICRKWGMSDHAVETLLICCAIYFLNSIYVTLEHKTSLKSLGYIYSNNQKYILWVKIIDFCFMPKIIRT